MIPSEYENIIQMLLNEVIRLRRESDTRFRAALAATPKQAIESLEKKYPPMKRLLEDSKKALFVPANTTFATTTASSASPLVYAPIPKKRLASNQYGHKDPVTGKWIKVPKRGSGGKFSK